MNEKVSKELFNQVVLVERLLAYVWFSSYSGGDEFSNQNSISKTFFSCFSRATEKNLESINNSSVVLDECQANIKVSRKMIGSFVAQSVMGHYIRNFSQMEA